MCTFRHGRHFANRKEADDYDARQWALQVEPAVAPKCVPASEADQSIFIEIIQPVKQEQFVSAYLVAR